MIEARRDDRGISTALCICDECGAQVEIRCAHELTGKAEVVNTGQATKKLQGLGWVLRGKRLTCPICAEKRRAAKPETRTDEDAMTDKTPTDLRQPTREQKREIITLLTDVYDTAAQRYRGAETDVTVAQTIGGGVLFGWVASIREELFGPDGGNEELESLVADIAKWRREADALATVMHTNLQAFNEARRQVAALEARMEAVRKAMGPKAALIRAV